MAAPGQETASSAPRAGPPDIVPSGASHGPKNHSQDSVTDPLPANADSSAVGNAMQVEDADKPEVSTPGLTPLASKKVEDQRIRSLEEKLGVAMSFLNEFSDLMDTHWNNIVGLVDSPQSVASINLLSAALMGAYARWYRLVEVVHGSVESLAPPALLSAHAELSRMRAELENERNRAAVLQRYGEYVRKELNGVKDVVKALTTSVKNMMDRQSYASVAAGSSSPSTPPVPASGGPAVSTTPLKRTAPPLYMIDESSGKMGGCMYHQLFAAYSYGAVYTAVVS
ncbi:hypothetical protein K474DRAFT_1710722 [Panus rudis PR-1116 ss-1]|nr:hypothetical protein K474DRAFT_1710722 [Panus rudis PR-1116 ss-1]